MISNIVVVDVNHGGLILINAFKKITKSNLFICDIYNKLTKEDIKELKKENINIVNKETISDINNCIVIGPVHTPPFIHIDYTHHQAVNYILKKYKKIYNFDFKIVEVTGVKGKTTVVNIISEILSDYNVLVLTSNGLIYKSKEKTIKLIENISITPASIITAFNKVIDMNLLSSIDICVFEVSLGVSSFCDIGVLTNIVEDYPISYNTSSASIAKQNIFNCRKSLCEKETYETYYKNFPYSNLFTIKDHPLKHEISCNNIKYDYYNTNFILEYNNLVTITDSHISGNLNITCFGLSDYYIKNICASICCCLMLEINPNIIQKQLKNINPIPGRSSYYKKNNTLIFEEINPGLNISSIKESIKNIKRYAKNPTIILGGEYGITCEEINEISLINYLNKIKDEINLIFTDELGYNLYKSIEDKKYYKKLDTAINDSIKNKDINIILIIYRSNYYNLAKR
ncbi:MAG: coenzyme F430 synthase [Methanobacteriaceae archaeon]|nr:coenzyme F430 synthase [Methanobacteriaceae archaeon]